MPGALRSRCLAWVGGCCASRALRGAGFSQAMPFSLCTRPSLRSCVAGGACHRQAERASSELVCQVTITHGPSSLHRESMLPGVVQRVDDARAAAAWLFFQCAGSAGPRQALVSCSWKLVHGGKEKRIDGPSNRARPTQPAPPSHRPQSRPRTRSLYRPNGADRRTLL